MNAPWTYLDLNSPRWALGGLLFAAWVIYSHSRSLVTLSRFRRRLSLATRLLVILCLSMAAAGLSCDHESNERLTVLLVDRSESMSSDRTEFVRKWIADFRAANRSTQRVAIVPFAGRVGSLQVSDEPSLTSDGADIRDLVDLEPRQTNIAQAMTVTCASMPSAMASQFVLLSDGSSTEGEAVVTAAEIGVPVHTVAVPSSTEPETQVSEIRVPAQVRAGAPFQLEVVINATRSSSAKLELYRNGLKLDLGPQAEVDLAAGETRVSLQQVIETSQTAEFQARVTSSEDRRSDDNTASALVIVAGPPRVLWLDPDPASLDSLRWALEDQGMQVDVQPPAALPSDLAELMKFDAIGLSDTPANQLTAEQQTLLQRYVAELGGGLLMLGGEQSFGLGGYYKTPVETVLPVRCDLEQETEKPSLAIVLVIDRSGSMGGLKLQLAKEAAEASLELLGPRDQIGVVAFDQGADWVAPLASAAQKRALMERIDQLGAAGGTNLFPALSEAADALRQTTASLKHVLVLTDGISSPADFPSLLSQMVADRITVSTVAVGDKADETLLQRIAQLGEGRFYLCEDPRSVPQIFAQETMKASKSAIDEEPFLPVPLRATPVLRGIDLETLPLLLGYVETRPKPTSEVVLATESGAPLLAWWQYGLGKTLAFTSDAKNRWASEWLVWPDFARFWAQCHRHVMRSEVRDTGQATIQRNGDRMRVTFDFVDRDQQFVNGAEVTTTVVPPDGNAEPFTLPLQQTAPGRYEAEFESRESGPYLMEVAAESPQGARFQQRLGSFVGYPEELRVLPTNELALAAIARQSGGQFNPSIDSILTFPLEPARRMVPLWRHAVALALVLLLVDVALRRLG